MRSTHAQRLQVSPCLVAVTAFSFLRSMTFLLKRAAVTGGRVATRLWRRGGRGKKEEKEGGERSQLRSFTSPADISPPSIAIDSKFRLPSCCIYANPRNDALTAQRVYGRQQRNLSRWELVGVADVAKAGKQKKAIKSEIETRWNAKRVERAPTYFAERSSG